MLRDDTKIGSSNNSNNRSVLALDLVRAMAAIVVMLGHIKVGAWVSFRSLPTEQQTLPVEVFFGVARMGREAVLIFFVLSGFFVGGNLIDRVRSGRFSPSLYLIDRATRIFVPLIPICFFTVFIDFLVFGQRVDLSQLIGNCLGFNGLLVPTLQHNVPLWSLSYEIWFYVIAGATAWLFARGANGAVLGLISVCVVVFAKLSAIYLLFWTLGAFAARFAAARPKPLLALLGVGLMATGVFIRQSGLGEAEDFGLLAANSPIAEALICAGFSFCLPFLCGAWINELLSPLAAPIRFMSGISYSLYLVHFPIVAVLRTIFPQSRVLGGHSIGVFSLFVAASVGSAVVFWFLFERNTASARRFLSSRQSHKFRPA